PATSPRGKSYSSGPATNPTKPAAPLPAPKSARYSSGAAPGSGTPSPVSSTSQKPGTGPFDSKAADAQNKAASKELFSGRSTATPATPSRPPRDTASTNGKPYPSACPASPGSLSGKSYTTGGSAPTPRADRKPASSSYDTSAAAAQRREESKAAFTRGQQPRSTWTDSQNQPHPIDSKDRQIESLRRQLDYERWVNRQTRQRQFYGDYYGRPAAGPVVVYHDPYSNFFWAWLLAQSLDQR